MYSHINWAICAVFFFFLFSLGQNAKSRLRSLRFAVPAGSNKLQTCFLSSDSTFSAPSLRQRPYHYPHKQQKCLSNFSAGGILFFFFLSPMLSVCLSGGISAAEAYAGCTKITEKIHVSGSPGGWMEGGTSRDLFEADWHLKDGWECLHCDESCRLIRKRSLTLVLSLSVKHESSVTGCECRLAGRKQAFLAAVPECHWSSTFHAMGSVCWLSALLVCDRLSGTGPDKEAPRRARRPRVFLVKGSCSLPRLESYKQH